MRWGGLPRRERGRGSRALPFKPRLCALPPSRRRPGRSPPCSGSRGFAWRAYPSGRQTVRGVGAGRLPVSSAGVHSAGVLTDERPILNGPRDGNRVREKTRREAWPDVTRREPPSGPAGHRAKRGRLLKGSDIGRIKPWRIQRDRVCRRQADIRSSPPELNARGGFTRSNTRGLREQVEYRIECRIPRVHVIT